MLPVSQGLVAPTQSDVLGTRSSNTPPALQPPDSKCHQSGRPGSSTFSSRWASKPTTLSWVVVIWKQANTVCGTPGSAQSKLNVVEGGGVVLVLHATAVRSSPPLPSADACGAGRARRAQESRSSLFMVTSAAECEPFEPPLPIQRLQLTPGPVTGGGRSNGEADGVANESGSRDSIRLGFFAGLSRGTDVVQ